MDEKLTRALEFANFKHSLFLEKRRLQEKLKSDLVHAYNGGQFYVDRTFIAYLNMITPEEGQGSAIVLDEKLNPIYIEDLAKFQKEVLNTYTKAVNSYSVEFERLRKQRTVKGVVDL